MGTREENRRLMESRIYEAALDLFCEEGYEGASLMDIAVAADVSTRTLYKYFPTKESILRKYGRETILSSQKFAIGLPRDKDLKEKLLDVMVYDYMQMFGLFDMSFMLHASNDDYSMFMLENFKISENVFYNLMRNHYSYDDAIGHLNISDAAFITFAVFRHATDTIRFENPGCLDERIVHDYYSHYLSIIWESIEACISSEGEGRRRLPPPKFRRPCQSARRCTTGTVRQDNMHTDVTPA